jgi:integrase
LLSSLLIKTILLIKFKYLIFIRTSRSERTLFEETRGRPPGSTREKRMLGREAKGLPRIIYQPEWKETLRKAKEQVGTWLACWLALDCIFGKRRNEICKLKRKDVTIEGNYLVVHFHVGKKKSRVEPVSDSKDYTKTKTLNHYAAPFILEYLKEYDTWQAKSTKKTEYLFPSKRQPSAKTVHRKFLNGKGEEVEKDYIYQTVGGYLAGSDVYYYVMKVNPDIWLHLGRTTVGTKAAERGASEFDIANILDVTPRTAWKYAEHGTAKTKEWNDEVT